MPRVAASSNVTTPQRGSERQPRTTPPDVRRRGHAPVRVNAIAHAAPSQTTAQDDGRSSAAPASALSFFPRTGCQLTANQAVGSRPGAAGERSTGGDARSLRIALACWTADVCRAAAAWGAGAGGALDSCGQWRSYRPARERRRFECLLRPVPTLGAGSDARDRLPARRPARPRPRRVIAGLPRSLRPPRRDSAHGGDRRRPRRSPRGAMRVRPSKTDWRS